MRASAPSRSAVSVGDDLAVLAGQRVDVDERGRPHDVELHQVDQRRAAGEELGRAPVRSRPAISRRRRGRRRVGSGSGRIRPSIFGGGVADRRRRSSDRRRSGRGCRSCIRGCRRRCRRGPRDAGDRRHDLAGRAIAALEGVVLDEGGLHRVQLAALGQALDGGDRAALDGGGQRQAASTRRPSTCTVQAPHWPWSQPFFEPVSARWSRSASSSVVRGSSDEAPVAAVDVERQSTAARRRGGGGFGARRRRADRQGRRRAQRSCEKAAPAWAGRWIAPLGHCKPPSSHDRTETPLSASGFQFSKAAIRKPAIERRTATTPVAER